MTVKPPFGRAMRQAHFQFSPSFTPVNHGSYGAFPALIHDKQHAIQMMCQERPDTFIIFNLPDLIDESRKAIAPLLGAPVDDIVFVPNATTAVNTVLRNLKWLEGDVIVHFSTLYGACEKTLFSIKEHEPLETVCIPLEYPIEDAEIVARFVETVEKLKVEGKNVRLSIFDIVSTFPGITMPWEELVAACKKMGVLSLIDGAHGIGHIDLTHLGSVSPDFFVSNCHKWLYTPRSCAVFHVPARNQHLIRTCLPTSHGYQISSASPIPGGKTPFVHLFEFVATIDYSPYLCIPAALEFREKICGGEDVIRDYCWKLARSAGKQVAEILGTEVMETESGKVRGCCFANVKLPLKFEVGGTAARNGSEHTFDVDEMEEIKTWLNFTAVKEFDTYLQIALHTGSLWVRLSAQIYVELIDFEWVAYRLKDLCKRIERERLGL